jgi:hypothetical protein
VFFSDGSSKTQQQKIEKFLLFVRPKIQNRLFLDFFSHVFGRFSMRGVPRHDKINIEKINLTLVRFRTLTHPPTTGVADFFFWGGPLGGRPVPPNRGK